MSAMSACFANPQQNPTTTHRLQLLERIRANIKRLQSQVLVDKVGTSTGGSARHKKRSSLPSSPKTMPVQQELANTEIAYIRALEEGAIICSTAQQVSSICVCVCVCV